MKSLQLQELDEKTDYDLSDYVFGLFSLYDESILNRTLDPVFRLEILNATSRKVLGLIKNEGITEYSNEDLFSAVYKAERAYLVKIADSLLNIGSETLSENRLENSIIFLAQKEISYFDSIYFQHSPEISCNFPTLEEIGTEIRMNKNIISSLFKNEKEFELVALRTKQEKDGLRDSVINKFFNKSYEDYIKVIKEKIPVISRRIFKHLIFLEIQNLTNEEISELIKYLMYNPSSESYKDHKNITYTNAKALYESNSWGNLIQDKRAFYSLLQSIKAKVLNNRYNENILSENELQIVSLFYWIKISPEQSLQTFRHLNNFAERKDIFAKDLPNNLILLLNNLEESISLQIKNKNRKALAEINSESGSFENSKELCISLSEKSIQLCLKALSNEEQVIQDTINSEIVKKVKSLMQYFISCALITFIISLALYSYWYFFDIDSIYLNNYLKNAKLALKATPYIGELKDSTEPIKNEIKQKQRLDYIKDLNVRYFKVFSLFLKPSVSDEEIKNSLTSISLQEELRDIKEIKAIRNELSTIFSKKEWHQIEPLIGLNVLTELRAYGAICNFLLPSLSHYVIEDKDGLPLKGKGNIQINKPTDEKELLKKDLIKRFNKISNPLSIEPKFYINHYDENYKDITCVLNNLLNKVANKKANTIALYKKITSTHKKERFKTILKGISILEIRLSELQNKVKERHNFIVKNNTYRALLE